MAAPKKYPGELRERAVRLYCSGSPRRRSAVGRAARCPSRGAAQLGRQGEVDDGHVPPTLAGTLRSRTLPLVTRRSPTRSLTWKACGRAISSSAAAVSTCRKQRWVRSRAAARRAISSRRWIFVQVECDDPRRWSPMAVQRSTRLYITGRQVKALGPQERWPGVAAQPPMLLSFAPDQDSEPEAPAKFGPTDPPVRQRPRRRRRERVHDPFQACRARPSSPTTRASPPASRRSAADGVSWSPSSPAAATSQPPR